MATFSIVLATFNEEKNLPECLNSVKGIADEIIVIDGESTDKTAEIARRCGAKVVVTENLQNFHINKQKAIDLATKDWILQLDADERLTEDLVSEIKRKVSDEKHKGINGFWMPRKNFFLGRFLMKGGQYPDYTLRLYRKGKGRLPQVHVHEQAEVVGHVEYLKHALLHYPYKNFASYLVKWNRYNTILASQIAEKLENKNFSVKIWFAVGYLIIKPMHWFLATYIRHKGFIDLWPGFVFSLFSALRFPASYLRHLKIL